VAGAKGGRRVSLRSDELFGLDAHISRAIDWFYATWFSNASGVGWAHYAGLDRVTEWGGTLEGVRALVRAGGSREEARVAGAIDWLKAVQEHDGGWKSWEIRHSCVEATSWVLITLRLSGEPADTPCVGRAADFLASCANLEQSHCSWGAFKGATPRIYPTLLAVWALCGLREDLSAKGSKWLKSVINADGGWGFLPTSSPSNVAMTSMTLYALCRTRNVARDALLDRATEWLQLHRESHGAWENVSEDWISHIDPSTKDPVPAQTRHFSLPWAIMALIKAGVPIVNPALLDGIRLLAGAQMIDGSWLFSRDDPKAHTWCVANAVWALVEARETLYSPAGLTTYLLHTVAQRQQSFSRMIKLHLSALYILTIGIIVYVSGFWWPLLSRTKTGLQGVSQFLGRNQESIVIGIFTSAVVAAAVGALAAYFRKRR